MACHAADQAGTRGTEGPRVEGARREFRSHPDEIAYLTGDESARRHYVNALYLALGVIREMRIQIEASDSWDPAIVALQLRRIERLLEPLV